VTLPFQTPAPLEALTWILGLVSTLGIGGAIAAVVLTGGAALPIIEEILLKILRCHPCMVVVVLIGTLLGGYWYGRHEEAGACKAAEIAAELRNREIDLERQSQARSDETERANRIAADAAQRAKDDADYIAGLKSRPGCLFDDLDAGVRQRPGGAGAAQPAGGAR